jgi:hypothetical protein
MSERQTGYCFGAQSSPETKMSHQDHDPHEEHSCDRCAVQQQESRFGREDRQQDRRHHARR